MTKCQDPSIRVSKPLSPCGILAPDASVVALPCLPPFVDPVAVVLRNMGDGPGEYIAEVTNCTDGVALPPVSPSLHVGLPVAQRLHSGTAIPMRSKVQ